MFSAVKFVVAAAIVALFGGFLLAGVLTTQQGDEMAPAAVTESPSPMTTEELLSGMVTEEVEPGVYKVINDGVRDLSSADYWGVFADQDGSIWLDHSGDLSRLGVAESHDWQFGEQDHLMDFEVAHDGTLWAVAFNVEGPTLRSFDGETWTTHRAVGMSQWLGAIGDVEVASDGVVWAALADGTLGYLDADGSTWQTIETPTTKPLPEALGSLPAAGEPYEEGEFGSAIQEFGFIATESDVWAPYFGGVWHYADGAWEHIAYGGADTGALPDDVFWGLGPGTGRDVVLHRHDGTGWRQWSLGEHDMLPGGWNAGPYAVAPDGSFWAGWPIGGGQGCQGVSRFDGRTWVRYLPGMCVPWLGMAIAPDGSMWVHAWEGEDKEDPYAGSGHLYVITPEAVAATEAAVAATEATDTKVSTTTASDILPGVALTVEELEPGVFRVISDGVRDLEQVNMTVVGDDGSVWMDSTSGIFELGRPGEHPGTVDGDGFLAFAEDGTLWTASDYYSLRSFDGETWTEQGTIPDGIVSVPDPWWPADYITDFAVHPDGTVWQVAEQIGDNAYTRVQHLGSDTWTTYAIGDGLPDLGCGADCEGGWETLEITPDGTVWVGVPPKDPPIPVPSGGLLRFDGTDWEVARPLGGDEDHGVVGLWADRDGVLWAEVETGDLARFDGTDWEVVRPLGGDEDHGAGDVLADRDGVLWAEFETGLARFDDRAWEVFSPVPAGDPDLGGVRAVDPDGNLWVGSYSDWDHDIASDECDGVRRFDGSTWTTFLPGMCVADIDIVSDGSVWVRSDEGLEWVPSYGYGGDPYVITPKAVAATD
jgi:hypothetical protein